MGGDLAQVIAVKRLAEYEPDGVGVVESVVRGLFNGSEAKPAEGLCRGGRSVVRGGPRGGPPPANCYWDSGVLRGHAWFAMVRGLPADGTGDGLTFGPSDFTRSNR